MEYRPVSNTPVRYRGFLLLPQRRNTWLVRPERSPMSLLPFRTNTCSLEEVKAILDFRLSENKNLQDAA